MKLNSLELVHAAIDDVNNQKDGGPEIGKSAETQLLGGSSGIDSMLLVNLVVAIEEKIEDATGEVVVVVTEDALSDGKHPFRTVGSLVDYIETIVG